MKVEPASGNVARPCLQAVHAPSPSALMPVRSIMRFRGPVPPRDGRLIIQCSLTTAQGAEIRHRPIQADAPRQALHKTGCLPKRHPELARGSARSGLKTVHWTVFPAPFTLQREARLDRYIAKILLTAALAARWRHPNHLRIKPTSRDIAMQCPDGQWNASDPRRFRLSL